VENAILTEEPLPLQTLHFVAIHQSIVFSESAAKGEDELI
jgi:hypothetical protein